MINVAKFAFICYNYFMRTRNLASGSDGNITFVEAGGKKLLIDDGLSCSETVKRLNLVGISPSSIDAIIISHEHSDHIRGVDNFSSKFDLPVYAHSQVWKNLDSKLTKVSLKNRRIFDDTFNLGEVVIDPVELPHDVKCYGFSIYENNKKMSILTDLGHINDRILNSIKGSALVYLEANYDKQMLMNGTRYPLSLKMRIAGPNGHLSNNDSGQIIEYLAQSGTRQIILSHLSKENNTPQLAYNFICNEIKTQGIIEGEDIKIDVASPKIGAMFRLTDK